VTSTYSVMWLGWSGTELGRDFQTFEEALAYYREVKPSRDKCGLRLGGPGSEHDGEQWFDGLTDEEREFL